MFEENPCCIQFLQDILKLEKKLSDEEFIALTKNCCVVCNMQVPKKEEDPRCFNVHVKV